MREFLWEYRNGHWCCLGEVPVGQRSDVKKLQSQVADLLQKIEKEGVGLEPTPSDDCQSRARVRKKEG